MKCLICNKEEIKNDKQLSMHLKKEHNLKLEEYLKQNKLWPNCKRIECKNLSSKKTGGYCSRICANKDTYNLKFGKANDKKIEKSLENMHKCKMCENIIKSWRIYCSIKCRNNDQEWKNKISTDKKEKFSNGKIINWTDKRLREHYKDKFEKRNKKVSEIRREKFSKGELINWTDKRKRTPEIQIKIDQKEIKHKGTINTPGWSEKYWTDSRRITQSKALKIAYQNPELREKISKLVSESMTPEVREKISNSICEMIINTNWANNIKKGYKSGYYDSIKGKRNSGNNKLFYRSSYELATFQYLDSNELVKEWYYEAIKVPYEQDNNKRNTVVDLKIIYIDDTIKLVEIKAKRLVNDSNNLLKFKAVKEFAKINNYEFEVWGENQQTIWK